MRRRPHAPNPGLAAFALFVLLAPAAAAQEPGFTPQLLSELRFRSIGPAVMGGRVHDVEALPDDPSIVYIATASGGLWKSTNKGTTWASLFDEQSTSSFGDVAIAPSDPNVVWVGTGEQNNRQSSTWGDGVYRSTDAGATWTHLGLEETRAIGRVLVDPNDPDVAWIGALGNLWAPSEARGVYKTTDGGRTWRKVLYVDTLTGVVDMVMDPSDPNTVYAATYQRLRRSCCFNGGGPGSGIYKTTDGGAHWQRLEGGLPPGDEGRIGLAISRQDPRLVYAVIENADAGGFYRSTDGGAHWERMNELDPRPMYYSHIFVDPVDDRRVYMLARNFYMSEDGGRTWRTMPTEPTYDVGLKGDYHAMWIDPHDTEHFYLVGDGGVYESWDRGETYVRLNNLPIGQFYGIGLDDETPYNIYGGMQDDHSWFGPSETRHWIGIVGDDWREIGFNDGLAQQVDLDGPHYVYSNAVQGDLTRVDAYTGDRADIHPEPPPGAPDYRWEWMSPGLVSQHTPGTYYYGGNRLFITHDRGVTWEATPDLTRQVDRDTIELMGVPMPEVRLSRNDGQSDFSAISAIAESPLTPDVLWVGTDDGNIQVSRDGGETWTEVGRNIRGAPDGAYISRIAASSAGEGAAFVAIDAHRRGDFRPYAFRTTDFGRTWTPVTAGLPEDGSVRTIAEYPGHPQVVFLGTEHALFVSGDAGAHWTRFDGLPPTIYIDVEVHPRTHDLVVATHGRSIYILDDASALAEWSESVAREPAHLFSIQPATIFQYWKDFSYRGQDAYAGENPPAGAILTYALARPARDVSLTVTAPDGSVVRRLEGSGTAGVLHRVVWDLRHEPPPGRGRRGGYTRPGALPEVTRDLGPRGPFVSPGRYTVTLSADGARSTQTVMVLPDPKMPLTIEQYREREAFLVEVLAAQQQAAALLERLASLDEKASSGVDADALGSRLRRAARGLDRLAGDFNGSGALSGTLYPPTEAQRRQFAELKRQIEQAAGALRGVGGPGS
ncbi:MAG TPA: hypothetical protein VF188_01280 [Longimicrobiales bacterium]